MQRELRRQREDMESTVQQLRQQTHEVQHESYKWHQEILQLKMQIDVAKERENGIKDLYERNIASLKQDLDF